MKNITIVIMLFMSLVTGGTALAQTPTDVFANCLIDTLNGKERKNLAKWIFFAIAAHPEISSYSSAKPKDVKDSDKYVGGLITRLLTVDCPNELKTAYKANPQAVEQGFQLVGKVAMQELMTNQNVMKAITNYGMYADQDKIGKILSDK
ncbi:MAG: hypothetical protein OQK73_09730 [Gammaproteobacteria bacterium]|nr:hypothetical protein [Gammaproteobacteria bacterium]